MNVLPALVVSTIPFDNTLTGRSWRVALTITTPNIWYRLARAIHGTYSKQAKGIRATAAKHKRNILRSSKPCDCRICVKNPELTQLVLIVRFERRLIEMTLRDLLDKIDATYNGDQKDLDYTVIVLNSEQECFQGTLDARIYHDDRNVTIETT